MNKINWILVTKIQAGIFLITEENHEKPPSQVGRHRNLNQGPPKFESIVLPLAR